MARGWSGYKDVEYFCSRVCSWCVQGGLVCSQGVTLGDVTLRRPSGRLLLSGKTTGAYLLPSAGLSTAHLRIDGKSMRSLQCRVNITNDQFKLAVKALLEESPSLRDGGRDRKVPVRPQPQVTLGFSLLMKMLPTWDNTTFEFSSSNLNNLFKLWSNIFLLSTCQRWQLSLWPQASKYIIRSLHQPGVSSGCEELQRALSNVKD